MTIMKNINEFYIGKWKILINFYDIDYKDEEEEEKYYHLMTIKYILYIKRKRRSFRMILDAFTFSGSIYIML